MEVLPSFVSAFSNNCRADDIDHLNHPHSSTEGLTHVGCVGWSNGSVRGWNFRLHGLCSPYQAAWH